MAKIKKPVLKKAQTGTSQNKNLVTVGRLKEVRDSLNNKSKSKLSNAVDFMTTGMQKLGKEEMKSSNIDKGRAERYDKIIKKAGSKQKMGGVTKKTVTKKIIKSIKKKK